MNRSSRSWQFAVGAVVLVVLAVVGWLVFAGGEDEPSKAAQPSQPVESTPSGPDRDAWRAEFSAEQLQTFDEALDDYRTFGKLMAPYEREPGSADDVRKIFERYSSNPDVDTAAYVARYVKGGVRIVERPEPLYVTGRRVEVDGKGGLVDFDQCTDYSVADVRKDGKPLAGAFPTANDTATLRVRLSTVTTASNEVVWRAVSGDLLDEPCA